MHGEPKRPADFKYFSYANPNAPKGGSLWLGVNGTYDNFNPFIIRGNPAPWSDSLLQGTLMVQALDEPLSVYGYIAKSYSMPKDRSWIEFHVNPKARFSDGSPITADDVIFSFNTLIKHGRPIYRYYYRDVLRLEKTGRLSVRFHLRKGQNRELPLIISELNILSKKFWQGRDFEAPLRVPPVSSGPVHAAQVRFRPQPRIRPSQELVGQGYPGAQGPVQLRHDPLRILPRRVGLDRGAQGRRIRLPHRELRLDLGQQVQYPRGPRRPADQAQGRHQARRGHLGLHLQHPALSRSTTGGCGGRSSMR